MMSLHELASAKRLRRAADEAAEQAPRGPRPAAPRRRGEAKARVRRWTDGADARAPGRPDAPPPPHVASWRTSDADPVSDDIAISAGAIGLFLFGWAITLAGVAVIWSMAPASDAAAGWLGGTFSDLPAWGALAAAAAWVVSAMGTTVLGCRSLLGACEGWSRVKDATLFGPPPPPLDELEHATERERARRFVAQADDPAPVTIAWGDLIQSALAWVAEREREDAALARRAVELLAAHLHHRHDAHGRCTLGDERTDPFVARQLEAIARAARALPAVRAIAARALFRLGDEIAPELRYVLLRVELEALRA